MTQRNDDANRSPAAHKAHNPATWEVLSAAEAILKTSTLKVVIQAAAAALVQETQASVAANAAKVECNYFDCSLSINHKPCSNARLAILYV